MHVNSKLSKIILLYFAWLTLFPFSCCTHTHSGLLESSGIVQHHLNADQTSQQLNQQNGEEEHFFELDFLDLLGFPAFSSSLAAAYFVLYLLLFYHRQILVIYKYHTTIVSWIKCHFLKSHAQRGPPIYSI